DLAELPFPQVWEALEDPGAHDEAEDRIAEELERFVVQVALTFALVHEGPVRERAHEEVLLFEVVSDPLFERQERIIAPRRIQFLGHGLERVVPSAPRAASAAPRRSPSRPRARCHSARARSRSPWNSRILPRRTNDQAAIQLSRPAAAPARS